MIFWEAKIVGGTLIPERKCVIRQSEPGVGRDDIERDCNCDSRGDCWRRTALASRRVAFIVSFFLALILRMLSIQRSGNHIFRTRVRRGGYAHPRMRRTRSYHHVLLLRFSFLPVSARGPSVLCASNIECGSVRSDPQMSQEYLQRWRKKSSGVAKVAAARKIGDSTRVNAAHESGSGRIVAVVSVRIDGVRDDSAARSG